MKYLIIILMFCSCAATKDRKAIGRVLSSEVLTDKVGEVWVKAHPCVPGAPITIPGKTLIDTITLIDHKIDSVLIVNCPGIDIKPLRPIIIRETRVDTIREPDLRLLDLCKTEVTVLKTKLEASQVEAANLKKAKTKWILAFWGVGIAAILSIIINFKKGLFNGKI